MFAMYIFENVHHAITPLQLHFMNVLFCFYLNNFVYVFHSDHGLCTVQRVILHCQPCSQAMQLHKSGISKHLKTKKHINNLENWSTRLTDAKRYSGKSRKSEKTGDMHAMQDLNNANQVTRTNWIITNMQCNNTGRAIIKLHNKFHKRHPLQYSAYLPKSDSGLYFVYNILHFKSLILSWCQFLKLYIINIQWCNSVMYIFKMDTMIIQCGNSIMYIFYTNCTFTIVLTNAIVPVLQYVIANISSKLDRGQTFFIFVDESPCKLTGMSVISVLFAYDADIKPILLNLYFHKHSSNAKVIIQAIDQICKQYQLPSPLFAAFGVDSTAYNLSAFAGLADVYPNLHLIRDSLHLYMNAIKAGIQTDGFRDVIKLFQELRATINISANIKSSLQAYLKSIPVCNMLH